MERSNVFNMPHDDNPKCREAGMKHQYHVMAPTLNYDTNPWSWSKCSRKYITEFLEYVHPASLLCYVSDVILTPASYSITPHSQRGQQSCRRTSSITRKCRLSYDPPST
ncbi:hypothetical protein XENOCAPTIV_019138 [Xenoophorus captivus]|uniref:Uncharacterized protein n=1 Tax=Xenoophorus captivus TaxID=1517983 RepID=A0ABV0R2G9_9TELE